MAKAKNLLVNNYINNQSQIIKDRNGIVIKITENNRGDYAEHINYLPKDFTKALIKKEDKMFYFHQGVNIKSTIKAIINYFIFNKKTASSTITQQLSKILLSQENDRNFKNKVKELFYTFSLEAYLSKKEILQMYENSIYFGNKNRGHNNCASLYYFNTTPELLSNEQITSLLVTMPNPWKYNPFADGDKKTISESKTNFRTTISNNNYFEIKDLLNDNESKLIQTTIDSALTYKIREIAKRNIDALSTKNATNTSIVIIKYPENEILSIIGTIDPESTNNGAQINMSIKIKANRINNKTIHIYRGF